MEKFELEKNGEYCEAFLEKKSESITFKGPRFGKRHIQVINMSLLVFISYYTRNCMSVALVAMNDRNASSNPDIPTFHWTTRNVIISAFFYGYIPLQLLISWSLHRIRIKVFAISQITICSIVGLLTPLIAVHIGDKGLIGVRVLQGLTQSFTFPLAQHVLAQWIPPKERSSLGGIVFLGVSWATVAGMIIPGFIAASSYGWPWIFYSSSIFSILWCVSYAIFSHDKPSTHPRITAEEQGYIEKSLAIQDSKKKPSTPFKAIFLSLPVWAITIAKSGNLWSFWTLQTQMPMYLKSVMKYKIDTTGSIAALPYVLQWLLGFVFGFVSDYFIQKKYWSIGTSRKVMTGIALFIPSICLILLQNSGQDDSTKVIILLNLAIGINGAYFCGYIINPMDLSINHAGTIMAVGNMIGQVTGCLAPLFVQAVVTNEENPDEWKYVFYTAAGLYIVTGLFYMVFASAETQPWNDTEVKSEEKDELNGKISAKI